MAVILRRDPIDRLADTTTDCYYGFGNTAYPLHLVGRYILF